MDTNNLALLSNKEKTNNLALVSNKKKTKRSLIKKLRRKKKKSVATTAAPCVPVACKEVEARREEVEEVKEVEVKEDPRIPTTDEFLERFQEQASKCLENAYLGEHDYVDGFDDETIYTTLCEDVFSLVNIQIDVLHEYMQVKKVANTDSGLRLVMVCLVHIIRNLHALQILHRDRFLTDMESSCAAANDFMRFIVCFDELMEAVHERYPPLKNRRKLRDIADYERMEEEGSDLVALYGNDAVYTIQRSQIFVMKTIQQSTIKNDLFTKQWENEFVLNEVAISIVKTMEDFLYDFHAYLSNEFLYGKIVGSLIQAVVCFYVKCLIQKAEDIRNKRRRKGGRFGVPETPFGNSARAVLRMMYDIEVLRSYFQNLVSQLPALDRLVEDELSVLVVVHESLSVSIKETNTAALEELILVMHKRTGANANVTRFIMQDLWLLAARQKQRRDLSDVLLNMEGDLKLLSQHLKEDTKEQGMQQQRDHLPSLRLTEVLVEFYEQRVITEHLPRPCNPCVKQCAKVIGKAKQQIGGKTAPKTTRTKPKPTRVSSSLLTLDFLSLATLDEFKFEEITHDMVPSTLELSKEDHEKRLRSIRGTLAGTLKLNNIRFVTKTAANFEKRLKRRSTTPDV